MTLPKGYGRGGRRAPFVKTSQKGWFRCTSGRIIVTFIVLCVVVAVFGMIAVLSLKGTIVNIEGEIRQAEKKGLEEEKKGLQEEKKGLQDRIYWTVMPMSIGITAVGFFLCVWDYAKESNHRNPYTLQNEQKQHTYDNIFGFLAGLAITNSLLNYYEKFLALIGRPLYSSGLPLNLPPFPEFYVPTLHLISFFVIAIPLTHSGYLFLSSIASEKEFTNPHDDKDKKKKNLQFRLVGVFIFSVILTGLLFFLGGSIATTEQRIESVRNNAGQLVLDDKTGEPIRRMNEIPNLRTFFLSNGFVFWLNIIFIAMIAWSITIRRLIEESTIGQHQPERIHRNWIWLDIFTLGFIFSTSLTIFYLRLINDYYDLLYFNLVLSATLVIRAVLNYYIGHNVYFPKPYQAKNESHTT